MGKTAALPKSAAFHLTDGSSARNRDARSPVAFSLFLISSIGFLLACFFR